MKIIKTIFITIIILIILAGVGAYVFIKNFNINQYKPQIIAELSKQSGRAVSIDNLGLELSLFKGVYAEARGIKIGEDPQFGPGDFVTVGQVQLKIDVMAYLTLHEIIIPSVLIDAPDIHIIRDENGLINAAKIGPASSTAVVAHVMVSSVPTGQSTPALALPNIMVQTITIANGTVLFTDKSQKPAMQIPISSLMINIKNFSLTQAFGFEIEAKLFANNSNIKVHGQAALNAQTQEVRLSFIEAEADLSKIQIANLVKAIPQLEPAGLQGNIEGNVSIQIPSLTAGPKGLGTLAFTGSLDGGKISSKLLSVPVEKIAANFTGDEKNINVTNFSLALLTGTVTGAAKITDYLTTQGLALKVKAEAIPIASFVGNLPEGMKLSGGVNSDESITAEKISNPDKFLNSLNGSGQFELKDGKIENFNVLKTVLSRIEFIPGLSTMVETNMPEKYKANYEKNATIFQKVTSSFTMTNGTITAPDIVILSDLFEANMSATADPKLYGKVEGSVKLPQDLSDFLGKQAPPLAYLKDTDGRILIPLTSFAGPLAKMKIMPNVKNLAKTAIESEGRQQLNKLLDKALGKEPAPPTDGSAPAQGNSSPERQLINNVLDKIFK